MKLFNKFKSYVKYKWAIIFEYLCLQICLLTNWGLRKLIIMRGKDPNYVQPKHVCSVPQYKSGQNLTEQKCFVPPGTKHTEYVKNISKHPILLSRNNMLEISTKTYDESLSDELQVLMDNTISQKIKDTTDAMYLKNDLILNSTDSASTSFTKLYESVEDGYFNRAENNIVGTARIALKKAMIDDLHKKMSDAGLCLDSDESKKIQLEEMFKLTGVELDHVSNMVQEHIGRLKINVVSSLENYQTDPDLMNATEIIRKLVKAKKLCEDMVVAGLCASSDKIMEEQLQEILKFPDEAFDALSKMVKMRMESNDAKKS